MSNKIKESNISDGAVTSNKIAPGTIAADRLAGSITNDQLAGSIANAKLTNSSITINGTSIALGASGNIVAGTDWQSVITADGSTNTTAVASEGYLIDTSSATHTINLPASPSSGDEVAIVDVGGNTSTNAITIGRNGSNIEGSAADITLSADYGALNLVYGDATSGWVRYNNEAPDTFIEATGGTESTIGNFKIHTFTSSGCFSVSSIANISDNNEVSYMVVAGGGGGGTGGSHGAGAGAGGYRESKSSVDSYTASPTAATSGVTVTAQTYPITVGAGGTGSVNSSPKFGTDGSNSIFSTITSTGGGAGGGWNNSGGRTGGSGSGAACNSSPSNFGAGNTPPVSPSQGNPGGSSCSSRMGGGGGAGESGNTDGQGHGGDGVTSSINGSPTTRAGGGSGAGSSPGSPIAGGNGGGGFGAGGPTGPGDGGSGTANTGGGGGGSFNSTCTAGSGGSGIVIIRYKYQ